MKLSDALVDAFSEAAVIADRGDHGDGFEIASVIETRARAYMVVADDDRLRLARELAAHALALLLIAGDSHACKVCGTHEDGES